YCGGGTVTLNTTAVAASYLWSNGATTQSTIVAVSGNYTVQITNANGCVSQSLPYLVGASPVGNPDICLVSVDSATGHNIIVWNEFVSTAIDYYNIYGEGTQANVFNLLGSVNYSSLSVYLDNNSIPAQQAYRYKISAVDTCSAETVLSNIHKTIHLTISEGLNNTFNLIWNHYEGFTFPSYNIYRGTNSTGLALLTTLASTLNSFTDLNPPNQGNVYYQIEAVNPYPCTPSKTTYYSTRSNIISVTISTVDDYDSGNAAFDVYPNPATDNLTIEAPQKSDIEILNIQGQLIKSIVANSNKTSVDISAFPCGMYFIKVKMEKGVAVRRFVKE
ncbi:MAG: T9SS type A sorting domain-containing protein, partial [Bacteroidales bacterium]